jgi:hypothetical protein
MPFAPKVQAPGDLVPSKDWNEAMTEITRLEKDKVNRAGDTVRGNFAVSGELGAANLFGGNRFRATAGTTATDGSDWVNYFSNGIYVDVNTSKGAFTTTPYYFASLHGEAWHWATTGGTSIYLPKKDSFRVYVRWADGAALDKAKAQQGKWHIQWFGVQVDELMMVTSMVMLPMFFVTPSQ